MWLIHPKHQFLLFEDDSALIVYNRVARTTSLLPDIIADIFRVLLAHTGKVFSQSQLEDLVHRDLVFDIDNTLEYFSHIQAVGLIEPI